MKIFQKNLLAFSVGVAAAGFGSQALASTTTLVSITPQKIVGNANSADLALSTGGAQSAFESNATNLVLQDGNNATDIFHRVGSKLARVSLNSLGQEAKNSRAGVDWFDNNNYADSANPAISSDGKLVVFQSLADNLDRLTADTNNTAGSETDIFLRDVVKKKTYRLSGIMDGADGNITPSQLDVDGKDIVSTEEAWKVMTQANDQSANPFIAGTLKQAWVSFQSEATNLSTLVTTVNRNHIYVVDLKTKAIELVSATHDPITGAAITEGNDNSRNATISPDGRFVVYESNANNLVGAPVTDTVTDIYIYDRKLFTTYQLSGVLGAVSPTGGFAVATEADDDSNSPTIAGGGKSKTKSYMIAFHSSATNLDSVAGGDSGSDVDVFVVKFSAVDPKDVNSAYEIKTVQRVSAPMDKITGLPTAEAAYEFDGTASNSMFPVIAGTDLAYTVAFRSTADNLLAVDPLLPYWNEDSNDKQDIYVYNSKTRLFTRANVDPVGQQGTADATNPAISPDGKAIGFDTNDTYLTPIWTMGDQHVYIFK